MYFAQLSGVPGFQNGGGGGARGEQVEREKQKSWDGEGMLVHIAPVSCIQLYRRG